MNQKCNAIVAAGQGGVGSLSHSGTYDGGGLKQRLHIFLRKLGGDCYCGGMCQNVTKPPVRTSKL